MRRPACVPGTSSVVVFCGAHALATADDDDARARISGASAQGELGVMHVSPYQVDGAEWLAMRHAALLSDDKGLSKTAQALLALPRGAPCVVVAPASVRGVWTREQGAWRPERELVQIRGRAGWRAPRPGETALVNYEVLPPTRALCACGHHELAHLRGDERHDRREGRAVVTALRLDPEHLEPVLSARARVAALAGIGHDHAWGACAVEGCRCRRHRLRRPTPVEAARRYGLAPGTVLIGDEVHRTKSPSADQTQRFRELASACDRVWGLSASPLMNEANELWEVYTSLGLERAAFGTRRRFDALYAKGTPAGPDREEILRRRRWVELGRGAADVGLQLPSLRYEERLLELSEQDVAAVEDLLSRAVATQAAWAEVAAGRLSPPTHGDGSEFAGYVEAQARAWREGRDRSVGGDDPDTVELIRSVVRDGPKSPLVSAIASLRRLLVMAKLPQFLPYVEECEEAGEPLVAFCYHAEPVQRLAERDGWGMIAGAVDQDQRREWIEEFQAGRLKGLACTIRAGGEGITLHRARLAAFLDFDWVPEANAQAAKRIHRRGQERGCVVTGFVADHAIDKHVLRVLGVKQALIEACALHDTPSPFSKEGSR